MSGSVSSRCSLITVESIKDRCKLLVSQLGELEQAQLALKDMQSVMVMIGKFRHKLSNEELKMAQLDEYLSKYHEAVEDLCEVAEE